VILMVWWDGCMRLGTSGGRVLVRAMLVRTMRLCRSFLAWVVWVVSELSFGSVCRRCREVEGLVRGLAEKDAVVTVLGAGSGSG